MIPVYSYEPMANLHWAAVGYSLLSRSFSGSVERETVWFLHDHNGRLLRALLVPAEVTL